MATPRSGRQSPARLVVALAVAGVLAIFLVYTALAGNSTPQLKPSQLAGQAGTVSVTARVVGRISGDAHSSRGLHFTVRDITGTATVPVVFKGSVPDLFKTGRDVVVEGRYANGQIAATGLQTKCPSKYAPAKKTA